MAKLPVKAIYGIDSQTFGQEVAAKRMAANFAARLRAGIDPADANALADMLDAVAQGEATTVALGFTSIGAPGEFDRDWCIYQRVEHLRKLRPSYAECYRQVAASEGLSVDRIKKIHSTMREADRQAHE